jgi:hypothetical protein
MANDGAASIHGVAIRVAALDATGLPAPGLSMYVSNAVTKVDFNAEIDTGPEIADRNADGALTVTWKQPDTMKRLTVALELMVPDPELEVMLTGGVTYLSGTEVMGFQYPAVNVDATPNGVSVEIWTRAVLSGVMAQPRPYWHWILPRCRLHKSGRTVDSNRMAVPFDGFAEQNSFFGTGPLHDITWDTSKVAQAYRDLTVPTAVLGATKIV